MRMSASWSGSQDPPNTRLWRDAWAPAAQFPSRFSPRRTDGRSAGPGANPHERRASSSVENPPERGRACPCAPRRRRSARRRAAAFVLTRVGGAKDQARDGRNLGPPTSAADRRRWPDPCKGWPSATASGGFGLDKRPASDILRRQGFDGQERASSGPPTRLPGPDTTQIFLLTKKTSYKGWGEGAAIATTLIRRHRALEERPSFDRLCRHLLPHEREKGTPYIDHPIALPISPTIPRRNSSTQATKMAPWITVTHCPNCAR